MNNQRPIECILDNIYSDLKLLISDMEDAECPDQWVVDNYGYSHDHDVSDKDVEFSKQRLIKYIKDL